MERRIELETRGKPPHEIKSLNVDNCRSNGSVAGLSDQFTDLQELSLTNTGLTSLKNFPRLNKLLRLELAENRLSSGLHLLERVAPNLRYLNISQNRFKSWHNLEPLTSLKELRYLEIGCENELSEQIFESCPHIKSIDGKDRNGLPKSYEQAVIDGEFEKRLSPILQQNRNIANAGVNSTGSGIPTKKRKISEQNDYNPSSSSETESEDETEELRPPNNAVTLNLLNQMNQASTMHQLMNTDITENDANTTGFTLDTTIEQPTTAISASQSQEDDDYSSSDESETETAAPADPAQQPAVVAPPPQIIQVQDQATGQIVAYQIPPGMDPNTFLQQLAQQPILIPQPAADGEHGQEEEDEDDEEESEEDEDSDEDSEDEYADRREAAQQVNNNIDDEDEESEDDEEEDF